MCRDVEERERERRRRRLDKLTMMHIMALGQLLIYKFDRIW
jgi:predicted nucleic acid-binding Zn ribbon protein